MSTKFIPLAVAVLLASLSAFAAPLPQQKSDNTQRQAIQQQNAAATNFNALAQQANTAIAAKDWQGAISPLQQLIALEPINWQLYSNLGDAQYNLGQYDQALASYDKGIQAAEGITEVDPKNPITDPATKKAGEAHMLTSEGNTDLKLRKNAGAIAAYTKAAALDPNPAVAYFNLCVTQFNTGNTQSALDFCDKAIAADPSRADAYFIRGSLLLASSKADKDGKIIAPPGTAEAFNKYLELAPNGSHAGDVKQMLQFIGSKIETKK